MYDNNGKIWHDPSVATCGCFLGCENFTIYTPGPNIINRCCSDWDEVALEHCPQGKNNCS